MIQFFYIAAVILFAGALFLGAQLLKKRGWLTPWTKRAAAIVAAVCIFYAYIKKQAAIYVVRGLNMYSPFGDNLAQTVLGILLVWFTYAAIFAALMSTFFDYKALRNITKFFSPLILLLDLILAKTYLTAVLGSSGLVTLDVRMPFMAAGSAIALCICLCNWLDDLHLPKKREVGAMLYALVFAVLSIMPAYVPQALFGFVSPAIVLYDFTEHHRIMLYFAVIIPFVIFHFIKDKSEDVKRFLMIYLSLALLFVYLGRWELHEFSSLRHWPLHLCNTAMFLIPLCLIFKMRRLFNFCLFINVMGSVMAMWIPGELNGLNALGTERVSFWINHYAAFAMPLLMMSLGLFKRPKFKEWCFAVGEFAVYFFAILFTNAWLTNYGECDFFFLNSDFVVSNVGSLLGDWAEHTMDLAVSFEKGGLTFTFYPVYQTIFFFVYIALTVAVWFLYTVLFSMWDAAADRRAKAKDYRKMKKELSAFLGGKNINEPLSGDGSPRLTLRHFSKKYGSNKFFSVEDVSFDVKGGEIFGFLGPNGAGKSTIIKSIVGIQPLSAGDIEICGYHVDKQAVQAKLQIGYVPDHYALYENLTGREYINYIADLYQVSQEYRDETIKKYTERFQLVDSFDNQMKTYSHGMKQKITIMAALVHNPKVWVLDEPLTGLDPNSIHEVKECMKEHAANGNIVFFSSHIIDVVEKICDRIAIIKKGKLRASAYLSDLEENGIELERFYLNTIQDEDEEEAAAATEETEAAKA